MCGMAVSIWSTCGFERKYVWYGCYNFNWRSTCGFELVLGASMCGMAVTS